MRGKDESGPSKDPKIRAIQEEVSRLDKAWKKAGGNTNPDRPECLSIRKEHHRLEKKLQRLIKLPPRSKKAIRGRQKNRRNKDDKREGS